MALAIAIIVSALTVPAAQPSHRDAIPVGQVVVAAPQRHDAAPVGNRSRALAAPREDLLGASHLVPIAVEEQDNAEDDVLTPSFLIKLPESRRQAFALAAGADALAHPPHFSGRQAPLRC
jgi:hypothetical protein